VEKRIFVFFVLSLLIWTSYLALQLVISPPPAKPGDKQPIALKEKSGEKSPAKSDVAVEKKSEEEKNATEKTGSEKTGNDAESESPAKTPSKSRKAAVRKLQTLGSLDPASQHSMLVMFDPLGAAIHRIELNVYHDLDDLAGYLGHLELSEEKSGCRVNVVGPGTPAAKAGLQVDDIITHFNDDAMRDVLAFSQSLKKTKPEQTIKLKVIRGPATAAETLTLSVDLIRRPLELIQPEQNRGAVAVDPKQPLSPVGPASYRTTLTQVDDWKLDLRDAEMPELASLYQNVWEVTQFDPAAGVIEFQTKVKPETAEGNAAGLNLTFVKRFRLPAPNEKQPQYHVQLELEFQNQGEKPLQMAYRVEGPNGLPVEGWWYTNKVGPGWGAVGARDIALYSDQHYLKGLPELISNSEKQLKANNPPTLDLLQGSADKKFAYLAVDTQYFAAGILPGETLQAEQGTLPKFKVANAFALPLNKISDKHWNKTTNPTFFIDAEPTEIAAGATHRASYLLFTGPKAPKVLEQYHLSELNEYGWFGMVSRTLLNVMKTIYWATGNYGISIILLTVIVRLCLLPLGIKQAKSAAVMQQLAPEIAKIKEKYAGNLEEQAKAQRELFSKHGFNPMGGCFLMFFQLPVFIGLYRCLSVDIELREAPLMKGLQWCSNLAGPDQLLRWKDWMWPYFSDEGNGWLGPYCNVLPLITIVLFVIQQKMFTPPATDEETKMQQKIMTFMTFFMGVLFYKVPAGLCIYFITSSIWGICERKLLPKPAPGGPTNSPPSPPEKKQEPTKNAPQQESIWSKIFGLADAELKASKKIKR
jgi:YidC/Oxa1 family membrane protein insertase